MPIINHIRATASRGTHMSDSTLCQETKQPKILDQVRQYLRLHHYSIHTERSYVDWIVRFIRFHRMRSRDDLFPAEPKIESFLTHLAMEGNVAPSTQNQAMNALVFLYRRVLRQAMEGPINAVRADRKLNVPVVMTRDEVAAVLSCWKAHPNWLRNCCTAADCGSWKPSVSGSRTLTSR